MYAPLTGNRQSVYRTELTAVVSIMRAVRAIDCHIVIYTDCKSVWKKWEADHRTPQSHQCLWEELWQYHDERVARGGSCSIEWHPSHQGEEVVLGGWLP